MSRSASTEMIDVQGLQTGSRPAGLQDLNRNSLHPFSYGWKRLARITGMQQHTERRSVRRSHLNVATEAFVKRPSLAAAKLQNRRYKQHADTFKRQALIQETLIESKPSQIDVEGLSLLILFDTRNSALDLPNSSRTISAWRTTAKQS